MASRGRLFPVCCTAEIPAEVMTRFIEANDENNFFFVFVDSLTEEYDEPSEAPVTNASSPNSPFIGKSTHECYELLQQLLEDTGSDIDYDCFAIMDERSIRDDTLLLAEGPEEEDGEAQSVRVPFDVASLVMLNFRAGNATASEYRERAEQEDDGVLKIGPYRRG
ncbi:hypothetical protein M409DRAFT_29880 [Zasmidium cellare ATCC 36951]|uniref:Uncharacterized protein n=1 Tax=Zasmidium cellare ATCC 36951 TaxID=1080233 RepID=A0A6A6C0N5_ZASCE|nr:uncharacterized protein M409DRAFT_29880 [Zasmidium cellare ATCC 36951]KAF2159720.1 hypothetical protein M409DRAFT_29880 [Zasmidium cellare ATCC 36951]